MNIKEKIGQRIMIERKAKGLTRKALAELTDDLKQSRINNWERGIRTPGPEEIKQLSKALDVSPAFLMCLTDNKSHPSIFREHITALIPILTPQQACNLGAFIHPAYNKDLNSFIPINNEVVGEYNATGLFALKMNDSSMASEILENDILIINPDCQPKPGSVVIAQIQGKNEIIIRRYKQLSISSVGHQFELLPINSHWASIKNNDEIKCILLGTVINLIRKI